MRIGKSVNWRWYKHMYTSKLGISDGIHILVLACQRVCTFLCILLAGFQHGQINKVIDMGMTRDEMTGNGLNRYDVAKFIRAELNRSGVQLFHDNPFFLFGIAAVVRFLSFSYSHLSVYRQRDSCYNKNRNSGGRYCVWKNRILQKKPRRHCWKPSF